MTDCATNNQLNTPHVPEPLSRYPKTPELLAPAGNMASLLAALSSGANAVYLGAGSHNARRNAGNFSLDELKSACDYAHLAGAKVYFTLNTAILPGELNDAIELARQAYYAGADALIVADIGLISMIAKELPDISLHASTQLNTHNSASLEWLASQGVSRVTLARELSISEIADLTKRANEFGLGVEVFAHGALCVCYSGQCLMSSLVGRRSANRGLCAQPCRLPYKLIDSSTGRAAKTAGDKLLSPLDLCSVELIRELAATGIASLKIEGRMKDAGYVAAVTSAYRQTLDGMTASGGDAGSAKPAAIGDTAPASGGVDSTGTPADVLAALERSYSRGFTTAYLQERRGNEIIGYTRSAGRSANKDDARLGQWSVEQLFAANSGIIDVSATVLVKVGEPLRVGFDSRLHDACATLTGAVVAPARSRAITEADIREHVGRVGATPFRISAWDIVVDNNAGLGFSDLHGLRREALELLSEAILKPWHERKLRRSSLKINEQLPSAKRGMPFIAALVRDVAAAKVARKAGAGQMILHHACFVVSDDDNRRMPSAAAQTERLWLPNIVHDYEFQTVEIAMLASRLDSSGVAGDANTSGFVVVNNIGELNFARARGIAFEVGPGIACYNMATLELLCKQGAKRVWLGPELSLHDLEALAPASPVPLGITVSGAQELMICEHCLLMAHGDCNQNCQSCTRRKAPRLLEDRMGYRFPVRTDDSGRSHIYNAVALDTVANIPSLLALGITGFMVDCTLLNNAQTEAACKRAARACRLAADGTGSLPKQEGTTTGHLFRGVL